MTRILLLGGAAKSLPLVHKVLAKGHDIVLCDRDPQAPCAAFASSFEPVSTLDLPALVDVGRRHGVGGVLAFGSDLMAESAAYVGQALGVPSNPYDAVVTMGRKDLFRNFLLQHGFATPAVQACEAVQQIDASRLNLPAMVKPVDSAGSTGVSKIETWAQWPEAFALAKASSRCGRVIVEEFIQMTHPHMIAGDAFVVQGRVVYWGLMNSHRGCAAAPFLPTGNSYPVTIEPGQREQVQQEVQRLVDALGIRQGPLNLELMFGPSGQLYVIEMAPRNGGNSISQLLYMATGIDLLDALVDVTVGADPQWVPAHNVTPVVASYMLHSLQAGNYVDVQLAPELASHVTQMVVDVKPGDPVKVFDRAPHAVGVAFMQFDSVAQQTQWLSRVQECIRVQVKAGA